MDSILLLQSSSCSPLGLKISPLLRPQSILLFLELPLGLQLDFKRFLQLDEMLLLFLHALQLLLQAISLQLKLLLLFCALPAEMLVLLVE